MSSNDDDEREQELHEGIIKSTEILNESSNDNNIPSALSPFLSTYCYDREAL